jgi:hypothetical protein
VVLVKKLDVAKHADSGEWLEAISAKAELQSFGSVYKYGVKVLNNGNLKYSSLFFFSWSETESTV